MEKSIFVVFVQALINTWAGRQEFYHAPDCRYMIYKFPFEAVLRHRKFLEESLQRELGDMKRALLDKRKKLQSLKKAGESFSEVLRKKIEGKSIKVSEVQLYTRFIERLSRQMDLEKKSISALVVT